MRSKYWLIAWFVVVFIMLGLIAGFVCYVDPYFHYHKPYTDKYYYPLNNQRSQNDGITKHFDYDAVITGTSMTENFKASEADEVFSFSSIKVPYSGGSYKEMNDNLIIAFDNNRDLKTVIRCLDYGRLLDSKDTMRTDLGKYPTYLYDSNPFNDVYYVFNKDIIFNRAYNMYAGSKREGFTPGITSFDSYSRWQQWFKFGVNTVLPDGYDYNPSKEEKHLTDEERKRIRENITQNVTSLPDANPDATFYYFLSPYSVTWWLWRMNEGTAAKWIEAEEYAISLIVGHENIKLFSFNNRIDITGDLNNYKDDTHYGEWINSFMLHAMHNGDYLITKDNYEEYIAEEKRIYTSFDYASLKDQEDYECDYYAAALLDEEIYSVEPLDIDDIELLNAVIDDEGIIEIDGEGESFNVAVGDISKYRYLVFNGKAEGDAAPRVIIYDGAGEVVSESVLSYEEKDEEWHQYLLKVEDLEGPVTINFTSIPQEEAEEGERGLLLGDLKLF